MEPRAGATVPQFRSAEMGFGLDEIHGIISPPPESGCSSSFTALLELPPPQAVELLVLEDFPAKLHQPPPPPPPPIFPFDAELVNRASRFSVFASVHNSPESNSILPASSPIYKPDEVKQEPLDSSPAVSIQSPQSGKRKERERKVKETNKKNKKGDANGASEADDQKLPYVHVRARRGQATDSHSLAERARREKINARMKLLQELVPGCSKISGTAMVLDEIINHVQGLQRQVEFLSMRLAAVDPKIDFNLNALLAAESGLSVANGCMGGISCQPVLPYEQINCGRLMQYQQPINNGSELHPPVWAIEEENANFMTPEPHF